jgi:hypothetical protein
LTPDQKDLCIKSYITKKRNGKIANPFVVPLTGIEPVRQLPNERF